MLAMGVTESAQSAYSAPIVLLQKKDQTHRYHIDYRKLNSITEFELEKLPGCEFIFAKVEKAIYFTKINLSMWYKVSFNHS